MQLLFDNLVGGSSSSESSVFIAQSIALMISKDLKKRSSENIENSLKYIILKNRTVFFLIFENVGEISMSSLK